MTFEESIAHFMKEIQAENDGKSIDFIIPGYASKQFEGYMSMLQDLTLCIDALHYFSEEKCPTVVSASIYYTVIILYGKCFTDSSDNKYPKLEVKDCFGEDVPHLEKIHEKLMLLRHNFAAHRGSTLNEFLFPYLNIALGTFEAHVRIKQEKRLKPTKEELSEYLEIIVHLIEVVKEKLDKAGQKLYKHMVTNYSNGLLANWKIAGPYEPDKLN